MGKITNLLNAKMSGNVGAMNFRRRGADTVVAERSYTNKSGGTGASEAQRLHRCKLANIVGYFRAIQPIQARAWEGKAPYVSDFNMLAKVNLTSNNVLFTKEEAQMNASVIAPYIVSRGSLPALNQYFDNDTFVSGIYVGGGATIENPTVAEIGRRIISLNENWRWGDKLSFCGMKQAVITVSGKAVPQIQVVYFEVTLEETNTTSIHDLPFAGTVQLDFDGNGKMVFLEAYDAAFLIHSRKGTGELETSEQRAVLRSVYNPIYRKYTSAEQRQLAMDSYGYQGEVLLTPYSEGGAPDPDAPVFTGATLDSVAIENQGRTNKRGTLVVNGRNLSSEVCYLIVNGDRWTPMQETNTALTYNLDSAGSYTVVLNGVTVLTWSATVPAVPTSITSIAFDGETFTSPQSGKLVYVNMDGTFKEPTMTILGASLSPVTAVGCEMEVVEETETKVVVNLIRKTASQFAVSVNGTVAYSGTAMELSNGEGFFD